MKYVSQFQNAATGYTQAALQYLMALHSAGFLDFDIRPLGSSLSHTIAWRQMPEWCDPLRTRREMTGETEDVGIIHHTPDVVTLWQTHLSKRNVALTVTETSLIPTWLARKLNGLAAIIVPSQWNKDAFIQSGVTVPVHVVPHALGDYWWKGYEPSDPTSKDDYVFGYAGTWNQRKNPEGLLRAYLRAFPKVGRARLALKLTASAGLRHYIEAVVESETGSASRIQEGGDIWIYDEFWDEAKMRWFHRTLDCYVSAHRGEGWGYGLHHAAALGKPVIHTGWSAPVEFLNPDYHPVLPYKMVQVEGMNLPPYMQDPLGRLEWADPDMDALAETLHSVESARPHVGPVEGMHAIRQLFGWQVIGERLATVVRSLQEG
jgi:glycosyltransferase involved in cell wall biosynthesis